MIGGSSSSEGSIEVIKVVVGQWEHMGMASYQALLGYISTLGLVAALLWNVVWAYNF